MPLADGVVLSTVRRFNDLILAPDESSRSCTFVSMPVTSKPFRGMTFSLSLTEWRREGHQNERYWGREIRTIEASYDRMAIAPLFNDYLDVWVGTSQGLKVVLEVGAGVGGRSPVL